MLLGSHGNAQHSDVSAYSFHKEGQYADHNGYLQDNAEKGEDYGNWWIPAGRLPFTWYANVKHLPDITNYDMNNQTYRFNQYITCNSQQQQQQWGNDSELCVDVDFPFGYGLTYNLQPTGGNVFHYVNLDLPAFTFSSRIGFTFSVEVANRGVIPCDEVVQVSESMCHIDSSIQ